MLGRKLTKTLSKVNTFVKDLQAGIDANAEMQKNINEEIEVLEDKSIELDVESRQAEKLLKLLND